ncbi:MAG: DUF4013 domain-containing protein [Candidatus Aureabacteria bacterium]|nr:DUF4013 domain-containing protein [Candidatus Auribacterota bacterium]
MKVDIKKALTYPFSDEKWIVKLIIGGLISLVPVLNFLSFGYIMRILKETSEGKEPKLPEWGDWENLFKEGAFGFLILLAYGIAMGILFIFVGIFCNIPFIGFFFKLIYYVLNILMIFLFPAWTMLSLIKYMSSKKIGDAFDFKYNYEKIANNINEYGIAIFVIGFIGSAISMLCCLVIPLFYAQLFITAAYGELYYITEKRDNSEKKEKKEFNTTKED